MTVTLPLRRLGGTQILITVAPTDTVATVKLVLERDHGIDSKTCRLHLQGKTLADDASVSSITLDPNTFIIIIPHGNNIRPPPPPPPPPPPRPPTPIAPPTTHIKPPSEIDHPSVDPLPSLFTHPLPFSPRGRPASLRATPIPPNFAELVANLMDAVPFPREQCERALRVSGFRPEQAASLLLDPADGPVRLLDSFPDIFGFGIEAAEEPPDPPNFAELVDKLCEVVRQPADNCVAALRQTGYDLEIAAALLLTGMPPVEGAQRAAQEAQQAEGEGGGQREGEEGEPRDEFAGTEDQAFESFTEDEKAQIVRLQEITGRDRAYVIQIFVACDKDEEATANCLLEGK